MADREVKARISLEDQLSPALLKIQDSLKNFHGGIISLHAGLELLKMGGEAALKAFEFLGAQMEKAFDEALEGEKATNRLKGALVQAGVFTEKLSGDLEQYIDTLEETVGANGEAAKGMIATGLQMGLNVAKAKELEQAARQLAAANNIDVNEAFGALQQSLAGNSRALGKMIPQVKELGAAQMKQGEAIAIVNKATEAQYAIYQTSLPAALSKTKVAFDNIYKALGETVTQSPAFTSVINQISSLFGKFTKFIEANQATITGWINDAILRSIDTIMILASTFDALYRVGVIAFEGIKGSIYALSLGIQTMIDGPIVAFYKALSYLPGEKGKQFNAAAESIIAHMGETAKGVNDSAANIEKALSGPTDAYKKVEESVLGMRGEVENAVASHDRLTEAQGKNLESTAALNAGQMALSQTYGGIAVLTEKQREQLTAQTQDRDNNLKDFKAYLDAKSRLAVDKEAEQQLEVDKVRAALDPYSEQNFQFRQQVADEQFALDLQKKIEQAEILGASQIDIRAMEAAAEQDHLANMAAMKEQFIQDDIARNEKMGDSWGASLGKIRLEQQKHGAVMGALQGVFASQQMQGTKEMFGNLASLRSSHSKMAFETGKRAAIVETMINTFKSATSAFSAMAGIPIIGPALGAAAAAAAIGAGYVQIQNIGAQQFNPGGQADSGMDAVPQTLSGRSFVLSGGERVVQPTANKDLTNFLSGNKESGGNAKPTSVYIMINGKIDQRDADAAVDTMIAALRKASERGQPIISDKGIVKSSG